MKKMKTCVLTNISKFNGSECDFFVSLGDHEETFQVMSDSGIVEDIKNANAVDSAEEVTAQEADTDRHRLLEAAKTN